MIFYINELYLWKYDTIEPRVLHFEPNKVNVITGKTDTGKTSLLHIINYCLLTSNPKIPGPNINEVVEWYGLSFTINSNVFFIARGKPDLYNNPSKEFYFSSIGEVPIRPYSSIGESELKSVLEREFNIAEDLVIPYGGKGIKAGSKVSFRYFLLMNTQSEDIIGVSDTFFDFKIHKEDRYRDAFDRIFDLFLGIGSIEKIILQQKRIELDAKLLTLLNKEKAKKKGQEEIDQNIITLVSRAQTHALIEAKLYTPEEAKRLLEELVQNALTEVQISPLREFEEIKAQKTREMLKLRTLESLERNSEKYIKNESKDLDSLKPIELLNAIYDDQILRTSELGGIINALKDNLAQIKESMGIKEKFVLNVKNEIKQQKSLIQELDGKLKTFPHDLEELKKEADKYIFIGELKTLLRQYNEINADSNGTSLQSITELQQQIEDLNAEFMELYQSRGIQLMRLNEMIQKHMNSVKNMFGAYGEYTPYYNYRERKLDLIPPGSATAAANIGSRSNHMFMHLILMLGFHEFMIMNKNCHVPQFLILDQVSQPYFKNEKDIRVDKLSVDDSEKLRAAFSMLNNYISQINKDYETPFQIILLEHAEADTWKGLDNFYLVDEFRGGRGLVM